VINSLLYSNYIKNQIKYIEEFFKNELIQISEESKTDPNWETKFEFKADEENQKRWTHVRDTFSKML
jgi:hypothetical protein